MTLFKEELFPIMDTKLRAGYHVTEDDGELSSFMSENFDGVSEFYNSYKVELVRTQDHVFYLRARDGSLMGRTTLSSVDMLVGRVLCYIKINLHNYDMNVSGWLSFDVIMGEIKVLVPVDKMAEIYKAKDSLTDQELFKFVDKVKTSIRRLRRLNFLMLKDSGQMFVKINSAIYRFSSDVRGVDDSDEIYQMIVSEGEMNSLSEGVGEYQEDKISESCDVTGEVQLDFIQKGGCNE
jgi:chromosome partition protein MukE